MEFGFTTRHETFISLFSCMMRIEGREDYLTKHRTEGGLNRTETSFSRGPKVSISKIGINLSKNNN